MLQIIPFLVEYFACKKFLQDELGHHEDDPSIYLSVLKFNHIIECTFKLFEMDFISGSLTSLLTFLKFEICRRTKDLDVTFFLRSVGLFCFAQKILDFPTRLLLIKERIEISFSIRFHLLHEILELVYNSITYVISKFFYAKREIVNTIFNLLQ